MSLTQQEFEVILADETKRVSGDIRWQPDADQSPAVEFRTDVSTSDEYPLIVVGRYNPSAGKLSFGLILRGFGRIYGLDLGVGHRNPDGQIIEGVHKNSWREGAGAKWAYAPPDITALWDEPVEVWRQFCAEAKIEHPGIMRPPEVQGGWPL